MSDQEHGEHIVSPGSYTIVIIVLLVLTGLTVAAAYVNLGRFNIVAALAIATVKATLVVLIFMHAKYVPQRTKLVVIAGIFWLALLLFLTLSDYASRVDYRGVRFPMTQSISHTLGPRG